MGAPKLDWGEYWQKRFIQLEDAQHRKGADYYADLERQYELAASNAEKKLAVWYGRYANNEGVSLAEARRILNTKELSEFRMDVNEYIEKGRTLNYSKAWEKQLERASIKAHISRLEALKLNMQQQIEMVYGYELDSIDSFMSGIYTTGYYHTAYEVQKGLGVGVSMAKVDDKKIAKLLSNPWTDDDFNYYIRICRDKSKLMAQMPKILKQACITGESYQQTVDKIVAAFGVGKKSAKLLVVTESAFFTSAAQKDCFNSLGVADFRVIATLDGRTTKICRRMDGRVLPMSEFEPGITAPPFHTSCRTITCPEFSDEFELGTTRAARDQNGKTVLIDSNILYDEWERKFVA